MEKSLPGRRLLPLTIDALAESDPDRAWATIPVSSRLSDGYRDVSLLAFANAINRAAWFLETTFGQATSSNTFTYIGKSDMRYHILSMAAAKTGYQVLFSSHINSLAAHLNLLELTQCSLFLSAQGVDVSDILAARSMNHDVCPELDDFLDSSPVEIYPMQKTMDQAVNDVFLILHSSGTGGLPKPIRITHGWIAANDYLIQPPEKTDFEGPGFRRINQAQECAGRLVVPFAPFHVISAAILLCLTVFGKSTYVFGPADRSMSPDDLLDAIEVGRADCTFCSPAVLEKYASSERDMSRLGKLTNIAYGGGVLSPAASKLLTERLRNTAFVQFFGASESGMWALYRLGSEDMDYLSIDAGRMGIEWRPVAGDSELTTNTKEGLQEADTKPPTSALYEPVMVRFKDPKAVSKQAIFQSFPNLKEYETGDLFAPHPIRRHTWKYAGRTDDLILFHHGIKFHPSGIEAKIRHGHDQVQEVLMWGDRHQQAVLLIELTETGLQDMEHSPASVALKDKLAALIDQVNIEAPVVGQISQSHVIFVTREKPLPRTSKGSVRRKEATRIYTAEIDEVYRLYGDKMGAMMSRVQ